MATDEKKDAAARGESLPELYSEEEMLTVEKHVEKYFGPVENVFHEIISPDIHVDIYIIKPGPERNYYTLVTSGMGAHRMNVPEELAEHKLERAELLICLPGDWELSSDDETWYWPLRWLKILARLPLEQDTWLGWGHSVPTGEPVAENAPFTCMLLMQPLLSLEEDDDDEKEGEAHVCRLNDGEEVNFYQVIPLREEEMSYKLQRDTDALLERFQDMFDVEDVAVVNIHRPSAVK